jgi:hypothetical protein
MITRIFILLGLIYQICFSFQREMDNLRYYYNIKDNCPENIKSVYCNYGYLSFCTGQTGAKLDGDI